MVCVLATACDTPVVDYTALGTPLAKAVPSSATEPDALGNLYWAQKTQAAAENNLQAAALISTQQAASATQAYQATQASVRLTQVEFDQQITAQAAAATQAKAYAQDTETAISSAATQARAYAGDTATAQAATETGTAVIAQGQATVRARDTEVARAMTMTAAQDGINAQTQEVRTWGPIVFCVLLAGSLLFFAWKLMGIVETRKRVIPQPHGAPLIIAEQRADLEKYLPQFLHWLAWLLQTRQVVVDQEKNMYPVTVIGGGDVQSPKLTDDDRQERVTGRRQLTQLARAMAGEADAGDRLPGETAPLFSPLAAADGITDGELVEIKEAPDTGQVTQWLDDIERRLLVEGDKT
jgi:hypothetical protein